MECWLLSSSHFLPSLLEMFLFSPGSGLGGEEIGRQEHCGRCYWCLILGPSGWQIFKDDSLGNRPGYLQVLILGDVSSKGMYIWFWQLLCPFVGVIIPPLSSLMISSHHLVSGLIGHDLKWPHAGPCLRHGSPLPIGNSCAFCLDISGSTVTPKWSSVSLAPSQCIFLRHDESRVSPNCWEDRSSPLSGLPEVHSF